MFKSYDHFKKATKYALEFVRNNPKAKMSDFRNALLQNTEFENTQSLAASFDADEKSISDSLIEMFSEYPFIVNHGEERVWGGSWVDEKENEIMIRYEADFNKHGFAMEEYVVTIDINSLINVKKEDDGSYTLIDDCEEEINVRFYKPI